MKTMLRVFFLICISLPQIIKAQCPEFDLGNDINLCFGNEAVLSVEISGAEYNWSAGETTQTISVVDGGEYKVSVTKDGCTYTDSIFVKSIPMLWSDFTFEKISDCMPVTYKFTDNSSSCEGSITNWFWDFGDGATSLERNPQHEYLTEGQFAVKLTITDNNGNTTRRSKKVTVAASSVSVNIGNDTTICFGSSLILDAGNPGFQYAWSTGETSRQITVVDDGTYSVIITSGGCVAKDTIIINTSASVSNKWSYTKGEACLPITVQFTDSSEAFCSQTISSWSWDFGDGTFSNEQHPVHTYTTPDSFLVKLTVVSTNGTTSTSSKKIGTVISMHSVDLPAERRICYGEQIELGAGVMDAEYKWTPSIAYTSSSIRNPTLTASSTGWYLVEVTKCMVAVKDSIYITVDSINKPMIRQSGNNLTTASADSYQWYRDGYKLAGATKKIFRIGRQGYFSVKVTNASGCSRASEPKFCMPASALDQFDEKEIRVKCTPNPSKGFISVLLSDLPEKPVKVVVYDRHGSILLSTSIVNNVNPLSMIKLSKGLYFVEVNVDQKKKVLPVIVQ